MRAGWARNAAASGLRLKQKGLPALPSFAFDHGEDSRAMQAAYTQLMLDAGFLASGAFYASYAHQPHHVDAALAAGARAFGRIREALEGGRLAALLRGPVAQPGVSRRA
jgi:hypothetical protein